MKITRNFERLQYFNFETNFLKNKNLFKSWSTVFLLKVLWLKTQHFHAKPLRQKTMLTQIEWGVQDGTITKKGMLPVTTLVFRKFYFSLTNSYEKLIWCTNYLNVYIHTFRKRWSFIWGCFFPVSFLKFRPGVYFFNILWYQFPYFCFKICNTLCSAMCSMQNKST